MCYKKDEIFICGTVAFAKRFGEATWQSKQCEIVAGVPETECESLIFKITAGERILPEYVRVVLSGCLKVAALKAVVYTIPSKAKVLRVQTSVIILEEPGVGKNQSYQ